MKKLLILFSFLFVGSVYCDNAADCAADSTNKTACIAACKVDSTNNQACCIARPDKINICKAACAKDSSDNRVCCMSDFTNKTVCDAACNDNNSYLESCSAACSLDPTSQLCKIGERTHFCEALESLLVSGIGAGLMLENLDVTKSFKFNGCEQDMNVFDSNSDTPVYEIINQWAQKQKVSFAGATLTNANLTKLDFSKNGVDFSGATDMSGVVAKDVNFGSGSSFKNRPLFNADFTGVSCINCDFSNTGLGGINLTNANLSNSTIVPSSVSVTTENDLRQAVYIDSSGNKQMGYLKGTNFSNAKMTGVNLTGLTLDGVNFTGINMGDLEIDSLPAIGFNTVFDWDNTTEDQIKKIADVFYGGNFDPKVFNANLNIFNSVDNGSFIPKVLLKDLKNSNAKKAYELKKTFFLRESLKLQHRGIINWLPFYKHFCHIAKHMGGSPTLSHMGSDSCQPLPKGGNGLPAYSDRIYPFIAALSDGGDRMKAICDNTSDLKMKNKLGCFGQNPIELLKRGFRNSCKKCDFSKLSASDREKIFTKGRDLSGLDFTGANFIGLTLDGINFTKATLKGANFSGSTLDGVNFELAILNEAKFLKPVLKNRVRFVKAQLQGAKFTGVTDSTGYSKFEHSALFEGADLTGAMFRGISFEKGADFGSTTLDNAIFDHFSVSSGGALFFYSKIKNSANKVTFMHSQLPKVRMDHANLNNAIFKSVNLEGAYFNDAILTNANFAPWVDKLYVSRGTFASHLSNPNTAATFVRADVKGARFNDDGTFKPNLSGAKNAHQAQCVNHKSGSSGVCH